MMALGKYMIPAIAAESGIASGALEIVGAVVRHTGGARAGQIHSFLQETGVAHTALESIAGQLPSLGHAALHGSPLGLATAALEAAALVQNEVVRQGLNRVEGKVDLVKDKLDELAGCLDSIQALGVANLAVSTIGIGVSIVGFGIMNARIGRVEDALSGLIDQSGAMRAGIEKIRQEQLANDFSELRSKVRLYEEGWLIADAARAAQVWLDVATSARTLQDRFHQRAQDLLFTMPPDAALADPLLDALAITGGLRMASIMACNEGRLAAAIAAENARQVEGLTGKIGAMDLVIGQLPSGIDAGSAEWDEALSAAKAAAMPISEKWRQREALVATRGAPLAQLERNGILPHDWLAAAQMERSQPFLLLAADPSGQSTTG